MKDDSFVERAVTRLIEAGLAEPASICGCREEEIRRLEKDLGVFLRLTGNFSREWADPPARF